MNSTSTNTNTSSSLSLHIQSIIADALTNVSSSNPNTPSQHVRQEAWTEVFGNLQQRQKQRQGITNSSSSSSSNDNPADSPKKEEKISIFPILDTSNPSDIELVQYRMEWEVQLLLRLFTIPHSVRNSPYLSNQCTGALPQFRNAPSQRILGNRDILPFLIQELNLHSTLNAQQHSELTVVSSLLHRQNVFLHALRYGDFDAWEQVHRNRSIEACVYHSFPTGETGDLSSNTSKGAGHISSWWTFGNGFARLQAWAERSVYLNQIVSDSSLIMANHMNDNPVQRIKELAMEGYKALDCKLHQGGGRLVQGADNLTVADIQLFGHLAEALCDVHLVTVVADYEHLIAFYQRIYETYFGRRYLDKCVSDHCEKYFSSASVPDKDQLIREKFQWIKDNDLVNASNQFNRVPWKDEYGSIGWRFKGTKKIVDSGVGGGGGGQFMDAIKIMQEVALHCRDLKEVLLDMKLQKDQEEKLVAADSMGTSAGSLFCKWRMGGDIFKDKTSKNRSSTRSGLGKKDHTFDSNDDNADEEEEGMDEFTKRSRQQMKKMMRQAKKNDEMWISAVIGATVIGLLASLSVSSSA